MYWEGPIRMASLLCISFILNMTLIQNTKTNYIFLKELTCLFIYHTGRNYRVPLQSLLTTRAAVVEDHFFLKFSLIRKKSGNSEHLSSFDLYSRTSEAVVFIFHKHLLLSHKDESYPTRECLTYCVLNSTQQARAKSNYFCYFRSEIDFCKCCQMGKKCRLSK